MARKRRGTDLGSLGTMGGLAFEAKSLAMKKESGCWVVTIFGIPERGKPTKTVSVTEYELRVMMTAKLRDEPPFVNVGKKDIENVLREIGMVLLREAV